MTESTRKKVIAGVMIVTVLWGYHNLKSSSRAKSTPDRPVATVTAPAPKVTPQQQPVPLKLVDVEQKAKEPWGTDPFRVKPKARGGDTRSTRKLKWVLSGILYNERSPVAVINRKQVKVGDTVDEAKVLKIDRKSVTLQHDGKEMRITVTKG